MFLPVLSVHSAHRKMKKDSYFRLLDLEIHGS